MSTDIELSRTVPHAEHAATLAALCALDPPACVQPLEAALAADASELRRSQARSLLVARPHPAWLALLDAELARAPQPMELALALARLGTRGALERLLARISDGTLPPPDALPPLGVALRNRYISDAGTVAALRSEALDQLRQPPESPTQLEASARQLALRGLARDPALTAELPGMLASESIAIRTCAAQAAAWLDPDPSLVAPLRAAIQIERDTSAFRGLAAAGLAHGVRLPVHALAWAFGQPDTAPDALLLAAAAGASPALDRHLRRALSDLRGSTRLRVAAAVALGELGERRGLPALLAALDDPSERVRLAALRAAAALGDAGLASALHAHARAEPVATVALLARDLAHALREGRAVAQTLRGERVLVLHAPAGPPASPARALEALLPDGRWLRAPPIAPGEWVLADLPEAGVLVWPLTVPPAH